MRAWVYRRVWLSLGGSFASVLSAATLHRSLVGPVVAVPAAIGVVAASTLEPSAAAVLRGVCRWLGLSGASSDLRPGSGGCSRAILKSSNQIVPEMNLSEADLASNTSFTYCAGQAVSGTVKEKPSSCNCAVVPRLTKPRPMTF